PYIEDSVLGLISQDSGLFLKNGGRPFMRQRLIHPPSQNFTSVFLTCSLQNSMLNTPISKGCSRLFKWAMHAGFFVSTWGGGRGEQSSTATPRAKTRGFPPGIF